MSGEMIFTALAIFLASLGLSGLVLRIHIWYRNRDNDKREKSN